MNRNLMCVVLVVLLVEVGPLACWAAKTENGMPKGRRPGVVLYKWKADMSPEQRTALAALLSAYDMRLDRKLVDGTVLRVKANRPAGRDEEAMAADLELSGAVEWAEPDYVEQAVATPNDPYYANQWQHVNIRSAGAWDITTGSTQVIVAVCDTGVDLGHPDLASRLVLPGWNTYLNNTNCMDTHGHGTMVAGFAAAAGNNGIGVAGVAWNVRILPIRITFADGGGSAYVSDIGEAITYGADHGAKVVNVSFSGYSSSTIISAADYAQGKGTLVVIAAANDGVDLTGSPDPASIVLVGATTTADTRASFSNYGTPIDVVAPGVNVWSTIMGGGYGYGSGTSFSSPITAGLAALIFSVNPSLTPQAVEGCIESTCKDLGSVGEDGVFGFGLIQADAAVAKAYGTTKSPPPPPPPLNAPSGLTASVSGRTVTLKWTDNSSAETGFIIQRGVKTKATITYTQVGTAPADAKTCSDAVVSANTYNYRVQAYQNGSNGITLSPFSNVVSIRVR